MVWLDWSTSIVLVPLTVVTVVVIQRIHQRRIKRRSLPPGPTPLPLLGSALHVNTRHIWLTFTEWREKYGDIIYVQLLNVHVIVLNSTSVATELLDKRSLIYSDRPFISVAAPYGMDFIFAFARYNKHWKLCRRIFQQTSRAEVALGFRPIQLRRARRLIADIINDSDEYQHHFMSCMASIAMSIVYDYEPRPRNDPMLSIIDSYFEAGWRGMTIKKILFFSIFPFTRRVPDWLPGSWIKREAQEACAWRDRMLDTPYEHVRERIKSKAYINPCMVSEHIPRIDEIDGSRRSEYECALKHASGTAILTMTETIKSTLTIFTRAMVENPRVWQRAQADIDAVVGTDRLPEFEDRPLLPYIDAIVREVLRWNPMAPLAFPHAVTQDDIYMGYFIPKGTMVIANVWGMSHDPVRYPEPEKFMPERFLNSDGALTDDHPREYVFGFGRRRCPGRYIADASLWSVIATMLATLDFNLSKDVARNDTKSRAHEYDPLPCRLTPRSHVSKEMLERVLAHQ